MPFLFQRRQFRKKHWFYPAVIFTKQDTAEIEVSAGRDTNAVIITAEATAIAGMVTVTVDMADACTEISATDMVVVTGIIADTIQVIIMAATTGVIDSTARACFQPGKLV